MDQKQEARQITTRLAIGRIALVFVLVAVAGLFYWSSIARSQRVPLFAYSMLVVVFFLVNALLSWHARRRLSVIARRDAARMAIESERILLGRVLGGLASTSNSLFWIARDDTTVDLFGPWLEQLGVEGSSTSLDAFLGNVVDAESTREKFLAALRERSAWLRIVARNVDGELVQLHSTATPVTGRDGRYFGLVGMTTNISGSLATQSRAERAQADLKAQTSTLIQLCRRVSDPTLEIQALGARLRSAAARGDMEAVLALVDQLDSGAAGLSDLVEGAMELASTRSDSEMAEATRFNVEAVIDLALQDVRRLQPAPITIGVEAGLAEALAVVGNADALRRVLVILLSNAVAYGEPDSVRLAIGLRSTTEAACSIDIWAAGSALTPHELSRLGEPFFRGSASRGKPGRGLSLALALDLARLSGLTLSFRNSPRIGEGLIASVEIPIADRLDD